MDMEEDCMAHRSLSGFSRQSPPSPLGWPVLYLNDGQNLYDDKLSFSGCSWRAAAAAATLIASGKVPPFVIVGMDHSGKNRCGPQWSYKIAVVWIEFRLNLTFTLNRSPPQIP